MKMGVLLMFEILLTFLNWSNAFYINNNNNELPCEFQDSINITNGRLQSDGAIVFQGTKYSKEQFATVNYFQTIGKKRTYVEPYLRGCPCNVRPCIRLCCPLGSFVDLSKLKRGTILQQIPCYDNEAAKNYESEIIDQNNRTKTIKLIEHFSYAVLQTPIKFYKLKRYRITNVKIYFLSHYSKFFQKDEIMITNVVTNHISERTHSAWKKWLNDTS